jgi:hypothetical protein
MWTGTIKISSIQKNIVKAEIQKFNHKQDKRLQR